MLNRLLILSIFLFPVSTMADDDDDRGWKFWKKSQNNATSPLYTEECSSCHIAYPPRFLSAEAWKKIMATLDNHYDDNAELDVDVSNKITEFLVANSGDGKWARSSNMSTLRISDSRYFVKEHDEVPRGAVGPNAKVKSYSNCQDCHTKADQGSFRERDIRIPGFRSWDD